MDDIVFTFDTQPFRNAANQISKGFDSIKKSANSFAKSTKERYNNLFSGVKEKAKETKEVTVSNFDQGAKKLVGIIGKWTAVLGAAFLSFRAMMKQIPEIGRAFQHAGNIALRNFFWPLRKLLIPMLNDMLAWVRDHRIMFVRWGTVLANAFRLVFTIVKNIIKLVRTLVEGFIGRFEAMFGKVTKRMSDIINIIMFKITALVQFLLVLLEPLFKKIGGFFADVAISFKSFIEGIVEGVGDITPIFSGFLDILERIFDALSLNKSETNSWMKALKSLGTFVGGVLSVTFLSFVQILDTFVTSLETIIGLIRLAFAHISGDQKAILKAEEGFFDRRDKFLKDFKDRSKIAGEALQRSVSIFTTQEGKSETKEGGLSTITPFEAKGGAETGVSPVTPIKPTKELPSIDIGPGDIKQLLRLNRPKKITPKEKLPSLKVAPGDIEQLRKLSAPRPKSTKREVNIKNEISLGSISIEVNSETDARRAGEEFGEGLQNKFYETFRKSINDDTLGVAS